MGDRADFAALLAFAASTADVCRSLGPEPLVYGSLAYVAHTGDRSLGLNDVDFLAPEILFADLAAYCLSRTVLSHELTTYHSLKVLKGNLKVSFDSIEHYLAGISARRVRCLVDDFSFQAIDRHALAEVYARGAEAISEKRAAYLLKRDRLLSAR